MDFYRKATEKKNENIIRLWKFEANNNDIRTVIICMVNYEEDNLA